MIVPLSIDFGDNVQKYMLSTDEVNAAMDAAVKQVTVAFAEAWKATAKQGLKSTRQEYVNSIIVIPSGMLVGKVKLVGFLPNGIESGMSAFDQKTGFLRSSKVKRGKNGDPYLTIPFRFAAPDSLGEASSFSGVLPKAVHLAAKKLPVNVQLSSSAVPNPYNIPKTRAAIEAENVVFKAYTHRGSIYAGISKNSTPNHSGYKSFRRVSLNSDPDSWIHSGLAARNFAEKALATVNIPEEIGASFDNFLDKKFAS